MALCNMVRGIRAHPSPLFGLVWSFDQCCQLADISAAKHNSGPKKISAAGNIRGRIFC
jgi:hypothetical protein